MPVRAEPRVHILTGGTNAGKSQILNIIKQGLGTLCDGGGAPE